LVSPQVKAGITKVLFDGRQLLGDRREYLSDHIGLYARLHRVPD
jgi:hypothetical protein